MITFKDGMTFEEEEVKEDFIIISKADGHYVVGHGIISAVNSIKEG